MTTAADKLLERCTPAEKQQAIDLLDYIQEAAHRGTMPEGTIQSLLNRQSPNVREAFATLNNLIETPRSAPFQPKLSPDDHVRLLDLDPDVTLAVKRGLDDAYITSELTDRLGGSDATRPEPELDMRDQLSAAFDHHEGSTND